MTTIAQDEVLKGSVHGLLLGCTLPVLAFNLMRRNKVNTLAYVTLVCFEVWHIIGHLKAAK